MVGGFLLDWVGGWSRGIGVRPHANHHRIRTHTRARAHTHTLTQPNSRPPTLLQLGRSCGGNGRTVRGGRRRADGCHGHAQGIEDADLGDSRR